MSGKLAEVRELIVVASGSVGDSPDVTFIHRPIQPSKLTDDEWVQSSRSDLTHMLEVS